MSLEEVGDAWFHLENAREDAHRVESLLQRAESGYGQAWYNDVGERDAETTLRLLQHEHNTAVYDVNLCIWRFYYAKKCYITHLLHALDFLPVLIPHVLIFLEVTSDAL